MLYNRACVHALAGRHDAAVAAVVALRGRPQLAAIRGHLDDIFAALRDDPDFRAALAGAGAALPTAPHLDIDVGGATR